MTDEQLIAELGLENAPADLQQRVTQKARATIELRVLGTIDAVLTPEQRERFKEVSEAGDGASAWDFLKNEVLGVDVSEVYEATLKDYIEDQKANRA